MEVGESGLSVLNSLKSTQKKLTYRMLLSILLKNILKHKYYIETH